MTNPFSEIAETLAEIQRRIDHLATTDQRQPEFINIDQACQLLNLSKSTVYKRTMNNELPFYKNGKKLLFKRSELIAFITKHKAIQPAPQGITIEN
jgi:excisionase family DNA binding protein